MKTPFDYTQPIETNKKASVLKSLEQMLSDMGILDYLVTQSYHEHSRPRKVCLISKSIVNSELFKSHDLVYRKMGNIYQFILDNHTIEIVHSTNIEFTSFWYSYSNYEEDSRRVRNLYLQQLCRYYVYPQQYDTSNLESVGNVSVAVGFRLDSSGLYKTYESQTETYEELLSQDWNYVAKLLLGHGVRSKDIATLEAIQEFINTRHSKVDSILVDIYELLQGQVTSLGLDPQLIPQKV